MLKGIRPEFNGDILQALSNMGHGDYLVVSDTDFPSDSVARHSRIGCFILTKGVIPAEDVAR